MGTFEHIRRISPYLFGLFAVMLVLFFTIGDQTVVDGLTGSRNNPQTAPIAVVNGEKILYKDFEQEVRRRVEQERANQKDTDAEIDEVGIRQQVWQQMLNEKLLIQTANKMDIAVTDDEIADNLIESPPEFLKRSFPDSAGNFNRTAYLDIISNPENLVNYMGRDPSEMTYEEKEEMVSNFRNELITIADYLRKEKVKAKIMSIVGTSASIISPEFAKEQYKSQNSSASVNYIYINPDADPKEIEVSDADAQEYYKNNKEKFIQDEQRTIKYAVFKMEPSSADSSRVEKRINTILTQIQQDSSRSWRDSIFDLSLSKYNGQTYDFQDIKKMNPQKQMFLQGMAIGDVAGPIRMQDGTYFFRLDDKKAIEEEQVKVRHILISFGVDKDSALALAKSLKQRAQSGEDFAELAKEYSEDPGSASRGGEYDFFPRGQMVKPFEDAAFGANEGEIVGPVETQYGYHVIKVTGKRVDESSEIKYSEIRLAPNVSKQSKSKVYMEANSIMSQVEEGVPFDTVVTRLGMSVDKLGPIGEQPPIMGSNYFTALVFQSDVGDIIEPTDLGRYGIIVAQLVEVHDAGIAPFELVKEEIVRELKRKKSIEMSKDRAMKIYNEVKNSSDLAAANISDSTVKVQSANDIKNNGRVPGRGTDPQFTGYVYKIELNKISEPLLCDKGYFIIQVMSRKVPSEDEIANALDGQIEKLKNEARQDIYYKWFEQLKKEAEIEDLRSKWYREY